MNPETDEIATAEADLRSPGVLCTAAGSVLGLLLACSIAASACRARAEKTPGCDGPSSQVDTRSLDADRFEPGDLILRRGRSLVSRLVLAADDRSEYSHIGILQRRGDEVSVIHAAPGSSQGLEGAVKIEPLGTYLAYDSAAAAALYRVKNVPTALRLGAAEIAEGYALEKTPFDGRFDLETEGSLYCTELVWRAYLEAGLDLVDGVFDELNIPLGSGPYILGSPQL